MSPAAVERRRGLMTDHSEHGHTQTQRRVRRHTGVVGLILTGERSLPKRGVEIVETARATEFFEEGQLRRDHEGGYIDFVAPMHSPDPILEALTEGRLLYKFTIRGSAPPRGAAFSSLTPGTYFVYADFVEGPDFDEGRWVARVVDEEGEVVSVIQGVEFKLVTYFEHIDEQEAEAHRRPEIHVHGLGVDEEANFFREVSWIVTSTGWSGTTGSCSKCFSCSAAVA